MQNCFIDQQIPLNGISKGLGLDGIFGNCDLVWFSLTSHSLWYLSFFLFPVSISVENSEGVGLKNDFL